jgi:AP-2 complex subunit alpha
LVSYHSDHHRYLFLHLGFGQANPELQNYAALRLLSALNLPHVTDTLVCVGSYIVSEFSEYLVKAGRDPRRIFEAINKHFSSSSNKAKAMMLNALSKLAVKYDVLKEEVQMICHLCTEHWDPDVQQRGV